MFQNAELYVVPKFNGEWFKGEGVYIYCDKHTAHGATD